MTFGVRPIGPALVLIALAAGAGSAARGQEFEDEPTGSRLARLNPLRAKMSPPQGPLTLGEVGKRIDHVAEHIRDDGIVVLKKPDVYSQARMTRYRRDFEAEFQKDLANFKLILSGRIARVDNASVESQTALSAALAKGSTVTVPTQASPPVVPALTGSFTQPRFLENNAVDLGTGDFNLGVEPTVYLDEKQRYLNHLSEIRRVNIGDDNTDSAGYGLYLVRMPVSITPGEKTVMGYGAEISVTAKHEFAPDFLASTFRNLVINDLVDLLGPPLYELVRTRESLARRLGAADASPEAIRAQLKAYQEQFIGRMKLFAGAANDPAGLGRRPRGASSRRRTSRPTP